MNGGTAQLVLSPPALVLRPRLWQNITFAAKKCSRTYSLSEFFFLTPQTAESRNRQWHRQATNRQAGRTNPAAGVNEHTWHLFLASRSAVI
jgi:hypothetical protein